MSVSGLFNLLTSTVVFLFNLRKDFVLASCIVALRVRTSGALFALAEFVAFIWRIIGGKMVLFVFLTSTV